MIGRDEELQILISLLDKTMHSENTAMITIIGEAGIGKSRLLYEFRNRIESEEGKNGDLIFFNARCTPEMQNVPCSVFRDILRYRMDIKETDSTESVLKKVETGMSEHLTRDEIHLACHYAGFDLSSSESVRKLMGTRSLADNGRSCLVNYFRGSASAFRTMMYLEDLHWADSTSLELIEHLAGDITEGRLLIIALSRPPLLKIHPDWGEGLPHSFLKLKPLSEKHSGALIKEILRKVEDLPCDIIDLIKTSSEGNPFYVEELIAMLVEDEVILRGDESWTVKPGTMISRTVPSTLTGVLQARLDSLPENEKEMLQKASVIGRLFWDLAVENLYNKKADIDSMLHLVQSRDLIRANADSAFASTREFLFKHAILRDVTYDTVLLELRKLYHCNIAEWLVSNSGDRISEFAGLIAEHFDRGRDSEKAVRWLSRSGRSAFSTSSYSEALSAFQRALDLVPDDSVDLSQLHLDAAGTLERLCRYDEASEQLQQALQIADREGQHGIAAKSNLLASWIASLRGQRDDAESYATLAYDLAERSGDRSILARAAMKMANFEAERDYEKILSYYRRSCRIYREMNDAKGIAIALLCMGNVAMDFENSREAEKYYAESLETYETLGDQWGIANCLGNLGNVSQSDEDYETSSNLHERSLAISRRIGDREGEVICNLNLGVDCRKMGNEEKSVEHYRVALRTAASVGLLPLALSALQEIAGGLIAAGKTERAALALLWVRRHDESCTENNPDEAEEMLSTILDELPRKSENRIRILAESFSLQEITVRILEEE